MATDNLYNDGTNIGIGLSTPESPLQVRGSGNGNITSILVDAETYTLGSSAVGYGFNLHPTLDPKASLFFKSSFI